MSTAAPLPVTISVNGSNFQLLCMWPPSSPPPPPPSNSEDSQEPGTPFQPWRPGDAYRSDRNTCSTIYYGHIYFNITYLQHQISALTLILGLPGSPSTEERSGLVWFGLANVRGNNIRFTTNSWVLMLALCWHSICLSV